MVVMVCCAMRCFIGFYGMTRSVRYTAASIRRNVYGPLSEAGLPTLRFGHFNLPAVIDNPRSGEHAILPDTTEAALLALDVCRIEPQDEAAVATELEVARMFADRFGDGFRSIANLCHQLRSLAELWRMIEARGVEPGDIVLLLRPDLLYIDPLDVAAHLGPLGEGAADLLVPEWQGWGGVNDRLAVCTGRAARVYATRRDHFADGCVSLGGMHSERFLEMVLRSAGLRVGGIGLRAARVRADGRIAGNDAAMLGAAPQPAVA